MVHSPSWEVLCLGDSLTRGRLGADWVSRACARGMAPCAMHLRLFRGLSSASSDVPLCHFNVQVRPLEASTQQIASRGAPVPPVWVPHSGSLSSRTFRRDLMRMWVCVRPRAAVWLSVHHAHGSAAGQSRQRGCGRSADGVVAAAAARGAAAAPRGARPGAAAGHQRHPGAPAPPAAPPAQAPGKRAGASSC
jgi:hypothetical protein